jgi:hypothetical protein
LGDEKGGSGVWGHLGLYSEFQANLGIVARPCLKEQTVEDRLKINVLVFEGHMDQ